MEDATIGRCSLVVLGTMCIYELGGSIPHNYPAKKKKKMEDAKSFSEHLLDVSIEY